MYYRRKQCVELVTELEEFTNMDKWGNLKISKRRSSQDRVGGFLGGEGVTKATNKAAWSKLRPQKSNNHN